MRHSADHTIDAQRSLKAAIEAVEREISQDEKLMEELKSRLSVSYGRRSALLRAIAGFESNSGPNTVSVSYEGSGIYRNTAGSPL